MSSARQIGAPGIGERDRDGYLTAIDGMTYGDDPSQGFARGRTFLHPRLGFSFVAPEGFAFDNGAEALLGVSPDGRALRMDAAKLAIGQSLDGYVQENWIDGTEPGPVERLDLNGMEAVTVLAKGREWTFRFAAIRLGPDVYRLIFAARDLTPAIDGGFRESLMTFRRLAQAEIDAARPLRLDVAAGARRRHGGDNRGPHGGVGPRGGALRGAERPRARRDAEGRERVKVIDE
ncbi:hypothetical protein [Chenggangzhangella methanolivorans]|uniref:hypothetical protein n=1 Tax=Chenggangzhangella methanolivorans TaxID=1437009 RepID=UPI0021BD448E|nr:hypothetical protein [Chenggangzhangella methanolivorans]